MGAAYSKPGVEENWGQAATVFARFSFDHDLNALKPLPAIALDAAASLGADGTNGGKASGAGGYFGFDGQSRAQQQ